MLDESLKTRIREHYARLLEAPGFRKRRSQAYMIAEVAKTLANPRLDFDAPGDGSNVLLTEAPTGTGKTVAYLIPGILVAEALDKTLVVSSATVGLQSQLIERDIPAICDAAGINVAYEIVKGRGRYACTTKLRQMSGTDTVQSSMFGDALWDRPPRPDEIAMLDRWRRMLDAGEWAGDRDTLTDTPNESLWSLVTTDANGCTNRRCEHFDACPFFTARRKADGARLLVANHDLVLTSLANEHSTIIPKPGQTLFVFDEAHHLPDTAINAFSASHSVEGAGKWLKRIGPAMAQVADLVNAHAEGEAMEDAADELVRQFEFLTGMLGRDKDFNASPVRRYLDGNIEQALAELGAGVLNHATALDNAIAALADVLEDTDGSSPLAKAGRLGRARSELGWYAGRTQNLIKVWEMLITEVEGDRSPHAKWIERRGDSSRTLQHEVSAAATATGPLLFETIWSRCAAAVLTSATLRSTNGFRYFRERAGLSVWQRVREVDVPSPFNLAEQGVLHVLATKASPKDLDAHTSEVADLIPSLIERDHGSLILCTSRKQMTTILEALPQGLRRHVLEQGSYPRGELIRRHAEQIERDGFSVLVGLAGMAEGLDLPGRLLEHVIVTKLPFGTPDGIIEQTVKLWIEKRGGNYFGDIVVPEVTLRLTQWCGRLIRAEDDVGKVTILDPRLTSTGYGRLILAALPPFARVTGRPLAQEPA